MRDLVILSMIVIFWFVLGGMLTALYEDPLIKASLVQGNSTYITDIDVNTLIDNVSNPNDIPLFQPSVQTKTKGFLDMTIRMFTFRIPVVPGIPLMFTTSITFLNYFLLLITGLIVYRLIRHGGG